MPSVSLVHVSYQLEWLTVQFAVLAEYLFRINGHTPSAWELKGTAVAGYTVAVLRNALCIYGGFKN